MEHPDIELLTQFALDDPLALDAATLVHIADCEQCTREIEQLQRVVDATLVVGGRSDLRTLATPDEKVWQRITADLDGEAASTANTAPAHAAAAPDLGAEKAGSLGRDDRSHIVQARHRDPTAKVDEPKPRRGNRGWQLLAAAVIGILVGGGATWVVAQQSDTGDDQPTNIATSTLSGFDGHDASGTAQLADRDVGPELTVDLDPGSVGNGFLQVWLLDAETGGMVALGVLDGDTGTFAVPRDLDLATFNQIDVSLEQFDGDPAHSAVSLARGPVP